LEGIQIQKKLSNDEDIQLYWLLSTSIKDRFCQFNLCLRNVSETLLK